MKQTLTLLFALTIFCSCGNNKPKDKQIVADSPKTTAQTAPSIPKLSQQDSIKATGRQILVLLKQQNFNELIKYFPNDGVVFSPYGYIDTLKSKKLTPEDFITAVNKNWLLTWGSADGTGDPIKLTVKAYLKRFAYNADYLNAEAVGYDQILRTGNTTSNLQAVYPKRHFIDYYFSGFDQKNNGMDWTSLRLVFEQQDGQYFLVAIVHDQWTI